MKRILGWCLSTVTVLVLLFGYHTSTSRQLAAGSETVAAAPKVTPTRKATSAAGGSAATKSATSAANRTVTGPSVSTRWGPVQVRVTTQGSTISDVTVVEYPTGNPRDEQINAYALPQLVQATLSAQSADVDTVSGATVTSEGYLSSLQAALDEARA